ncbi:hypothetical protein [Dokdonella sp.]|uniref:hypothetical protein n=1 Tax=Dokdonella sp. TaxID=2291710 RepID=UPI0035276DD8
MTELMRVAALSDLIRWSPICTAAGDPGYTLPFAEFVAADLPVEYSLARLAPLLEQWPETPPALRKALSSGTPIDSLPRVQPGLQPTKGWITKMPLYCALWAQPLAAFERAGRVAQAAVLLAAAILEEDETGLVWFPAAAQTACLSVRRIGQNEHTPTGFSEALGRAQSLVEVLCAVEFTRRDGLVLTPRQNALLAGISVLVKDAVDERMPRSRKSSGGRRQRIAAPAAEIDDLVAQHSIHEQIEDGLPDLGDIAEGTAAVAESPQRSTITVSVPLTVPAAFVGPQQMLWRATYAARGIRTSAQSLLLAGDRLQLVDLEAGERYATELREGGIRSPSVESTQGAIVAAAMLVTGLSMEGIRDLQVAKTLADVPSVPTKHYLVAPDALLVIPGPRLKGGFVPSDNDSQHYRPVLSRLTLKLPQRLNWIQLLLDFANQQIGNQPFGEPAYVEYVGLFTQAVNDRFGSRLTPARISQFLARQLVATSGDRADAALITGGMADARLYYYAPVSPICGSANNRSGKASTGEWDCS